MKKNKLLGLVLALSLMAGLVIGTAATAYADDTMTITLTIAPPMSSQNACMDR